MTDHAPELYAKQIDELGKRGVTFHSDLSAMLAGEALDVVCLPTDISSHVPYSIEAMEAGCDVICEKPLCATVQDALRLIAARDRLGRKIAVGYQQMYDPQARELKRRLVDGALGPVRRIRCKISAPRADKYYARNSWAGRLKNDRGQWVLDSPANNATAHQLQHMLFLAGPTIDETARPGRVYAELYRGRPDIDNFDTCAIRVETDTGAELLYLVSHCVAEMWGPDIEVVCEGGRVVDRAGRHREPKPPVTIHHLDGHTEELRADEDTTHRACRAFTNMINALEGGAALVCTPDNTWQQTLVINAAHDSCRGPSAIDLAHTAAGDVQHGSLNLSGRYIKGGEAAIEQCYAAWKTFAEAGLAWACPAEWVDTQGYTSFPRASDML